MKIGYCLVFALLLFAGCARCETSVQGRLIDDGVAAGGQYDFEVRFYAAATGGSEIHPVQTFVDHSVDRGSFFLQVAGPAVSTSSK